MNLRFLSQIEKLTPRVKQMVFSSPFLLHFTFSTACLPHFSTYCPLAGIEEGVNNFDVSNTHLRILDTLRSGPLKGVFLL